MSLATTTEISRGPDTILSTALQVHRLTERDRDEALTFLSARPLHTVIMAGWILDHGVVSPAHRGIFYGYRDSLNQLQGVALIGHNTLFEVRTEEAMAALAGQAATCSEVKMIMAESSALTRFWRHFNSDGTKPRKVCKDLLYHVEQPAPTTSLIERLRPATRDDLELVVAAHAEMVTQETGINPLENEPVTFRDRCAARLGRIWISRDGEELIFKADVLTRFAGISYIEGVWVNPAYRGRGICRQGLNSLHQKLFANGQTPCCFVEVSNQTARNLYQQTGYQPKSLYSKIYL